MSVLRRLYKELDFENGDLMPVTDRPCRNRSDWIEKGEWLAAGKRAGANSIFFVRNNPVAVFAESDGTDREKVRAFNRVWCLARPRLLFLASPGELTVYDLNQAPVDENRETDWKKLKDLETLDNIAEVATQLQQFHRDHLESGRLFGDERFGDLKDRADKALIRDLKTVRVELIEAGLSDDKARFAHALIGRSIFIRYLEDRGVLTEKYFRNVAGTTAGWTQRLTEPVDRPGVDFSETKSLYARAMADKAFTYALFRRLAKDFNGDMFPDVEDEEAVIKQEHLNLLQGLLYGDLGSQRKLFFYSYRFDIVPLDLISSIYEEFYHSSTEATAKKSKARQDGAYYTPSVLVEFVLSRVLTESVLNTAPRVLDPACGSGIFLVEAFRRIVRHRWHRDRERPTFDELTSILRDQIAGIEVNPEAARIAAFSLYLSMLHYLDPPAILQHIENDNKLPNLIASTTPKPNSNHFHCILPRNAFDTDGIEATGAWRDRFGPQCADVVVGNPPWGAPGKKADPETKARHQELLDWCEEHDKPISDNEPSQAFLWRVLDLLRPSGKAGMLVPAGILFKHSRKAQVFRSRWVDSVQLNEVFNLSHVRRFFFKDVKSPFLAISFTNAQQRDTPVIHWVARQTSEIQNTQVVALTKHDCTMLLHEPLSDYCLWKTLYVGSHSDRVLLKTLRRHSLLGSFVDRNSSGQGFKVASKDKPASALKDYPCLQENSFSRYDPLGFTSPPPRVHALGVLSAYSGQRLLVQRGIDQDSEDKGQIVARYETEAFCFTNAVNGVKLTSPDEWRHKTILGILWSSLARYFFLLTSSNWGVWHDEIHLDDELLRLPVVLDGKNPATARIVALVDKLRNYHPAERSLQNPRGKTGTQIAAQRQQWESQLDEAVFDLYGLLDDQRDLIRDVCDVTLPLMYKPFDSLGARTAVSDDGSWIEQYVRIFSRRWKPYLAEDEEMRAEVRVGAHGDMVAVEFYPASENDPWDLRPKEKEEDWGYVLDQLSESLPTPMGTSQIVLDGLVYGVSDRGIMVVNRNEKRLWTRSLAREDADTTLAKRALLARRQEGGKS
jgi:hypothetical protein